MNPRIRWVGIVLLVAFGLLFLQLNNIQVRQSKALSHNPLVEGSRIHLIYLPRGAILSADDKILAYSKKTSEGELRVYPDATATAFAQITGFMPIFAASSPSLGIEAEYYRYLSQHESSVNSLHSLLTQHEETDNVVLTVPSTLQLEAASLVSGRPGAEIVALDPRNGDILAMAGFPTYNPNALSGISKKAMASAKKLYARLEHQYPEPYISIASDVPHPPGSTFKVMDTAAIFDHDRSLANHYWPYAGQISIPGATTPFHNYDGEDCGGNLANILAVSCDTAYAEVGLSLGAKTVVGEAEHFGWCQESAQKPAAGVCASGGSRPPIDLPTVEVSGASMAPVSLLKSAKPYLAYSAIGQFDDSATALSMALVAAGVADGGKVMTPHLMAKIIDSDGNVVVSYHPHVWKRATSARTAAEVRQLMLGPAETGTAAGVFTNLQSEGIKVAAKTGTAENVNSSSAANCATNDWLIAMAPAGKGQTPTAVVAVEVPTPNGVVGCSDATGATVAGPLIDKMLTDVLQAGK